MLILFPADEQARLMALARHDLCGSGPEAEYDQLVELGRDLFDVPICAITAVDADVQWLKAQVGLDVRQTTRAESFCTHTILSDALMVVLDATRDPRFAGTPLVAGAPHIRFYAGAPIVSAKGLRLGAFCIIDSKPRTSFGAAERELLRKLAAMVSLRIQARPSLRPARAAGSFADASALALITADAEGRITFWNPAAEGIFGHKGEDAIGSDLDLIIPDRFHAAHRAGLARIAAAGATALAGKSVEVTARHADGREFPIEISLSAWEDADGLSFGAQAQDISSRKARESELHELAQNDPLTGLLNAKGFRAQVDARLREGRRAIVLAMDLDGFKAVNDSLGHGFGDAVLQVLAIRLRALGGEDWAIARLGGDEFAYLLPEDASVFDAREAAAATLRALGEACLIEGYCLHVGASIGIAMAPDHADQADELMVRADLAMFRAKKEGGGTCRLFDRTMGDQLNARRAFRDELCNANAASEWELHYQPQYRLADGLLTGVEALLRWRHPVWGIMAPSTFLPVLETHVLADEVGGWVLNEACRQLADWRARGFVVPRVSVNLFCAQLYTGALTARVRDALRRHGLAPADLELEITETIALRHDDAALAPLFGLIDEGVGIAFDDFGTGFASLTTLQRFPLTRLKIDRSFVAGICGNAQSIAVVGGILAIGKALGVEVIAEGIETAAQQRQLAELGCDEGQGYLYARPTTPADLERDMIRRLHEPRPIAA